MVGRGFIGSALHMITAKHALGFIIGNGRGDVLPRISGLGLPYRPLLHSPEPIRHTDDPIPFVLLRIHWGSIHGSSLLGFTDTDNQ
jgi:hypothetical protein